VHILRQMALIAVLPDNCHPSTFILVFLLLTVVVLSSMFSLILSFREITHVTFSLFSMFHIIVSHRMLCA